MSQIERQVSDGPSYLSVCMPFIVDEFVFSPVSCLKTQPAEW
jgi:hypothetical protein